VLESTETIIPHTFRHSFATTLVEEGENLFKIQKILGHAHIGSTIYYARSARPVLKSCVNPLDKVYEEQGSWNMYRIKNSSELQIDGVGSNCQEEIEYTFM